MIIFKFTTSIAEKKVVGNLKNPVLILLILDSRSEDAIREIFRWWPYRTLVEDNQDIIITMEGQIAKKTHRHHQQF